MGPAACPDLIYGRGKHSQSGELLVVQRNMVGMVMGEYSMLQILGNWISRLRIVRRVDVQEQKAKCGLYFGHVI